MPTSTGSTTSTSLSTSSLTTSLLSVNKGFTAVYLLIAVVIVLIGGVYCFTRPVKPVFLQPQILPTPTPSPWKTYINQKYGFSFTYPKEGVIWQEKGYQEGECGQAISEEKDQLFLDNFYKIQIVSWEGTVDDYLISRGAKNQYNIEPLEGSGADEAIKVLNLKKGSEYAVGYPPLVYIDYIYKASPGDFIFLITNFPSPTNKGGCIHPKVLDPAKYAKYINQGWDFGKNFKFY